MGRGDGAEVSFANRFMRVKDRRSTPLRKREGLVRSTHHCVALAWPNFQPYRAGT